MEQAPPIAGPQKQPGEHRHCHAFEKETDHLVFYKCVYCDHRLTEQKGNEAKAHQLVLDENGDLKVLARR